MATLKDQPRDRKKALIFAWIVNCVVCFNSRFGGRSLWPILLATVASFVAMQIAIRTKDKRLFALNISLLPLTIDTLLASFYFHSRFYIAGKDILLEFALVALAAYIGASLALLFSTANLSVFAAAFGLLAYVDPYVPLSALFITPGRDASFGLHYPVQQSGIALAVIGFLTFAVIFVKEQLGPAILRRDIPEMKYDVQQIGEYVAKTSIILPQEWNEQEISGGIQRYKGDNSLLLYYAKQVVARFVDGQQTKTAEYRLEFLKKQSELLRAGLENYKLRREITRVVHQEDAADIKAKSAVASARRETGLDELRHKAEEEALLTQIAEQRKKRADLSKPEPQVPVPPVPAKQKVRSVEDVEADITKTKKSDAEIDASSNLSPQEKMVRKNINADKRQKLYEELANLS